MVFLGGRKRYSVKWGTQEKTLHLNKLMNGDVSFNSSTGWIDQWKERHGVYELSITGKRLSANHAKYVNEFADVVAAGSIYRRKCITPTRLT